MTSDDIELKTERILGSINREPLPEHIIVSEGIEKYIEVSCIEACQKLWSQNITTFESSGTKDGGWIAISYDYLSDENKKIFMTMIESKTLGYSKEISYKGYDGIYVLDTKSEEEVSEKLLELANIFQMQDIKYGVMSREDYLMRVCLCANHEVLGDGTIAMTFEQKKMTKTLDEYLEETGGIYLEEEDRVYLNSYYYNKHLNYIKYLNGLKEVRDKLISSINASK